MTAKSNLYGMRQLALSDKISNRDFDIFMYFLHNKWSNIKNLLKTIKKLLQTKHLRHNYFIFS